MNKICEISAAQAAPFVATLPRGSLASRGRAAGHIGTSSTCRRVEVPQSTQCGAQLRRAPHNVLITSAGLRPDPSHCGSHNTTASLERCRAWSPSMRATMMGCRRGVAVEEAGRRPDSVVSTLWGACRRYAPHCVLVATPCAGTSKMCRCACRFAA